MENPIKIGDLGVPLFLEKNIYISMVSCVVHLQKFGSRNPFDPNLWKSSHHFMMHAASCHDSSMYDS